MFNLTKILILFTLLTPVLSYKNNVTCALCTDLVDVVKHEMKVSNSSINIIEEIINATCHTIIIKPQREECIDIVDSISNITKWIIDGLYPKQICEKLGFCVNYKNLNSIS